MELQAHNHMAQPKLERLSIDQWQSARGIGASDVAAILGLSEYQKAGDVWARLKQGTTVQETEAMRQGRLYQRGIVTIYEDLTGATVTTPGPNGEAWLCRHPRHEWATCSPDGLIGSPGDYLYGLEVKRSQRRVWGDTGTIQAGATTIPIPEAYFLQCLWSMYVTGLSRWDLCALVYGEAKIYQVQADIIRQEQLFQRVAAWYEKYIIGESIPEPDGSHGLSNWQSSQVFREVYVDTAVQATAQQKRDALRLNYIRREISRLETEAKMLSQYIIQSTDYRKLDIGIGTVSIVHSMGRTTVDANKLKSDYPDVYKACSKTGEPSISVRISIRDSEEEES